MAASVRPSGQGRRQDAVLCARCCSCKPEHLLCDTEVVRAQGWSDTTKPEDISGKMAGAAEMLIPCLGEFIVK